MENVSKSFGEKVLFSEVNFSISKGEKIALVAQNGTGKTTLLKVIAGEERVEGENAHIEFAKGIKVAFLRQEPQFFGAENAMDAIFTADNPAIQAVKDYESALLSDNAEKLSVALARMEDLKAWDIEVRAKEILGKLNITKLDQPISNLSGGQRKRLALAKILIEEPDFLILDEPTNHLDLEMIEWLEQYLHRSQLTIFMVTHDRYFLERVCSEIIELDRGKIFIYRGNYTDYLVKKEARTQNEAVVLDKTKKLYRKELEWVRRMPKARTTKAKSRLDSFQEIKKQAHQRLDNKEVEIPVQISRLGSKILELHGVTKRYDHPIVEDFSYKFKKKEKLGIIGPNGAGKSTFLRLITQETSPDEGRIVVGETVTFGHYRQEGLVIEKDKRVIEVIRDIAEYIPLEKGQKLTAESLLERFLFPRSQQRVYVSQLSGGEKRRLHLLTVLMKNPNFLILDEPTNDLDILTLNVLEDYLENFPGVLIIVTHDRYFMDKLVDHLFVITGDGKVKDYNGTYTMYRAEHGLPTLARSAQTEDEKKDTPITPIVKSEKPKVSYSEKMEFKKLEKRISSLEDRKSQINASFLDGSLDGDQIQKLSIELGEINKEIEESEDRWMVLAEKMGV